MVSEGQSSPYFSQYASSWRLSEFASPTAGSVSLIEIVS
jgi:hypothetical protein